MQWLPFFFFFIKLQTILFFLFTELFKIVCWLIRHFEIFLLLLSITRHSVTKVWLVAFSLPITTIMIPVCHKFVFLFILIVAIVNGAFWTGCSSSPQRYTVLLPFTSRLWYLVTYEYLLLSEFPPPCQRPWICIFFFTNYIYHAMPALTIVLGSIRMINKIHLLIVERAYIFFEPF